MVEQLPQVFVIGSSTTLLMHPHLEAMLAGVCRYSRKGCEGEAVRQAMADLDTTQGASAGDSSMVLAYLRALERDETFHPDLVLLHVGMHDIKVNVETGAHQVPLEIFRRNMQEIVAWFTDRRIRVVWLTPGPLDEQLHNARTRKFRRFEHDLHSYCAAAESILRPNGVALLDLAGFTRRLGPLADSLKDHIHFHDAVVRQQAAFVSGFAVGLLTCPDPAS